VLSNSSVVKIVANGERIDAVVLKNKKEVRAKKFIFATGGLSHPETGSTGDGFTFLKELGHTVNDTNAALVPLALYEPLKRAAGVALRDAKITAYQNDAKQAEREGKILFTHVGLSGPAILNMSRDIGELLKYGEVVLELDLLPHDGPEKVNAALQEILRGDASNKMLKNVLSGLIPPGLVLPILDIAGIDGGTASHSVTRAQRLALAYLLKHLRVRVKGLLGLEKAIITSGGVALEEIDWKTMRSLKYDNLSIVGDLLDIDRPSGGYSLQLCWTTGFVAGSSAAEKGSTLRP
jgi:predicted Rossmann fold flavoprotein